MDQFRLPLKPYFRIGEVAELLGVETHVLRYWESEFPQLKPVRAPSRQRLYRRRDVETLLVIKDLLHGQGYTIAGAKKRLDELAQAPQAQPSPPPPASDAAPQPAPAQPAPGPDPALRSEVVGELKSLLKLLS